MAVSVQAPFYPESSMWNQGDPPTAFSPTGPEGNQEAMSYQYPLAPGLESPSGMIPSYHHPPIEHARPLSPATANHPSPNPRNRGGLVSSKSAKIKRSMSTPNVRGQASTDAAALALSAEKRRNKLGYHRTSVACGHCRRRKIRCISAPADPQNRCSNCIRLKKECTFYPVDQQPPPDPRGKNSKLQGGLEGASESSSPSISSGQIPEMSQAIPYSHMNMPPIQDLGGPQMKRQRTESFSPESSQVVTTSRNFDYNHGPINWMAPDAPPNTKAPTEGPQSLWRNPQDSPMAPAFSPYTPNLQIPPAQNWPGQQADASPREDLSWQAGQPQRSMSYGNLEHLPSQHSYPPYTHGPSQPIADHYTTKPRVLASSASSGMYPPPIATSGGSISGLESHDGMPHHSANSMPSGQFSNWQPPPYSYQKPANASPDNYGRWNGSRQEEPDGPGQGPPPGYAYGEPSPGGMYYPPGHQGR